MDILMIYCRYNGLTTACLTGDMLHSLLNEQSKLHFYAMPHRCAVRRSELLIVWVLYCDKWIIHFNLVDSFFIRSFCSSSRWARWLYLSSWRCCRWHCCSRQLMLSFQPRFPGSTRCSMQTTPCLSTSMTTHGWWQITLTLHVMEPSGLRYQTT